MPKKKIVIPPIIDPAQRFSLPESAAILRQGLAQTYRDIKDGRLSTFKDGKRTYVSGAELIRRSKPPTKTTASANPTQHPTA